MAMHHMSEWGMVSRPALSGPSFVDWTVTRLLITILCHLGERRTAGGRFAVNAHGAAIPALPEVVLYLCRLLRG
jgi:hypothetical protein